MEFALVIVTVLSLLLTLAMGVVAWRLVHEERRRSEARLAALTAELQEPVADNRPVARAPMPRTEVPPARPSPVDPAADVRVGFGDLFGAPAPSTSSPATRLAALGAGAALVTAVVATLLLTFSGGGDVAAPAAANRLPVELLELDHATEGQVLSISGAVRNPPEALPADQLSVVAMAFDESGALVASERSPVARESLPPGAASLFEVEVPATGVRRYRISFLIEDDTVPHVDRRIVRPPDAVGDPS